MKRELEMERNGNGGKVNGGKGNGGKGNGGKRGDKETERRMEEREEIRDWR